MQDLRTVLLAASLTDYQPKESVVAMNHAQVLQKIIVNSSKGIGVNALVVHVFI